MAKEEKVFAVFGLGAFGMEVCRGLIAKGGKVIAFDSRTQPIEKIKDLVNQVMVLDSTDEDALRSAPLENVDVAIVAIGDDVEASILTTAILKDIGVPYIVARAVTDVHMRVLRQIGANEVINLEIEEGQRVASRLLTAEILETIPVTEDYSIVELYVPEGMVGKSLERLNLRADYMVNVIAIERFKTSVDEEGNPVKEERVILPTKDDVLLGDDILIVVGRNTDLDAFREGK
jgi:trk system potassium uptake protein TrkA